KALDGRDLGAVCLHGEHRARLHRTAVEMDRARATVGRVASDVRTGEPEVFAKRIHKQRSRLHLGVMFYTVDAKAHPNWCAHTPSLVSSRDARSRARPYSSGMGM